MKRKINSSIHPLIIILLSIIIVFCFSRFLTYLVLSGKVPTFFFAQFGDYRLHHFVYGNAIIVITSFLAIGLGIRKHKSLFALFYGIGLGMVLDEFLLWIGNVEQLTSNVMWIPHSFTIVALVSVFLATLIVFKLYNLKHIKYARTSRGRGH